MRFASKCILTSQGTFMALIALSMASYPGGTWADPRARGHDLLRNFLCDLLGRTALNGEANPVGAIATPLAMLALVLGIGLVWWVLPACFPKRTALGLAIRILGSVSTLGLLALPLTPPAVAYELHATAAFAGGGPGLVAGVLSIVGLAGEPRTHRLARLSAVALLCIVVGVGLYAQQLLVGGAPSLLLPISHRLATAFLLIWMTAVALQMNVERPESAAATDKIAGRSGGTGDSASAGFRN
jgi:hypothetical protein